MRIRDDSLVVEAAVIDVAAAAEVSICSGKHQSISLQVTRLLTLFPDVIILSNSTHCPSHHWHNGATMILSLMIPQIPLRTRSDSVDIAIHLFAH